MITVCKALAVCAVLLVLVSTAAPQGKRTSWLRGSWEGIGYQTDDGNTWPMRLTIKRTKGARRSFSIDYPSLNCGGRWKLIRIHAYKARFREQLNHGQDKCADHGLVSIERISNNQIVFLYSYQGSPRITASAVLNKKKIPGGR
jgi:hypothetical protein